MNNMSMKIDLASLLADKGVNAEGIDAKKLTIETSDGKVLSADSPSIAKTRFFGMDVLLILADLKDEQTSNE
ncbi:hypothetical protein [Sulfuracidifex tepidarius]|nr:hypothetical protein [Sulfuracidifex tepidarius]